MMRRFWKKTPPRIDPLPARGPSPAIPTGGAVAHKRAEENLAAQVSQQPEVTRVAESLRELRERNHFALQIRLIFQGGHPE